MKAVETPEAARIRVLNDLRKAYHSGSMREFNVLSGILQRIYGVALTTINAVKS